jgi:2-haloacid dehalogenase
MEVYTLRNDNRPYICTQSATSNHLVDKLSVISRFCEFIILHKAPIIMTTPSSSWRPKAIIFDLLTALLDSWALWDASIASTSSIYARSWRIRYLELTFGTGAYVPYEQLVHKAAQDVGLPDSAPRALLQNWGKLQPWPEAAQILEQLRFEGYKLGVVTNCSQSLGTIAAGIVGDFDAVVTAEESGFYKPAREAYQAILTAMGVQAQDVLFVAGSAGDVEGAANAGMKVVWHNKARLPRKGKSVPLREATSLDNALLGFL